MTGIQFNYLKVRPLKKVVAESGAVTWVRDTETDEIEFNQSVSIKVLADNEEKEYAGLGGKITHRRNGSVKVTGEMVVYGNGASTAKAKDLIYDIQGYNKDGSTTNGLNLYNRGNKTPETKYYELAYAYEGIDGLIVGGVVYKASIKDTTGITAERVKSGDAPGDAEKTLEFTANNDDVTGFTDTVLDVVAEGVDVIDVLDNYFATGLVTIPTKPQG